ncbi:hypothetical protein LTR17_011568 [Elasticomyces elasticus]|nr:hypothetical protein LTR17_011568 [Elasticomyces elasticus]
MLANATKYTSNAVASSATTSVRANTIDKRSWKESPTSHHISATMNDLALAGAIGTPFLVAFTLILCYCCFCLDRKPSRFFWIQGTKKGILPTHHPPGMFNHYEWGPFINTGNGNFHSGPDKPSLSHTSKSSSIRYGHRRSRRGSRYDGGIHISASYGDQAVRDERPPQPAPVANDNGVAQALADIRALLIQNLNPGGQGQPQPPRQPPEPYHPPDNHSDVVSEVSEEELDKAEDDAMREKALNRGPPYRPASPLNAAGRENIRREQQHKKEQKRARERERERRHRRRR